ncbi:MAG: hypothetical protein COW71_08270 [Ignavibacteriales bacterium CG18_big_fil_WC_8_21_14_2_50_31_20]|nr:MAG: hypothetical protein COW71_08270 [Ignavibacteriales bacterium CG18_big_fil_WC_8_21_14_2_50_31_20]
MDVSYISDVNGNQTAVIIGIDDWKNLLKKQNSMKNKLEMLTGLQKSVEEIKLLKKNKGKAKTLREFLDEN